MEKTESTHSSPTNGPTSGTTTPAPLSLELDATCHHRTLEAFDTLKSAFNQLYSEAAGQVIDQAKQAQAAAEAEAQGLRQSLAAAKRAIAAARARADRAAVISDRLAAAWAETKAAKHDKALKASTMSTWAVRARRLKTLRAQAGRARKFRKASLTGMHFRAWASLCATQKEESIQTARAAQYQQQLRNVRAHADEQITALSAALQTEQAARAAAEQRMHELTQRVQQLFTKGFAAMSNEAQELLGGPKARDGGLAEMDGQLLQQAQMDGEDDLAAGGPATAIPIAAAMPPSVPPDDIPQPTEHAPPVPYRVAPAAQRGVGLPISARMTSHHQHHPVADSMYDSDEPQPWSVHGESTPGHSIGPQVAEAARHSMHQHAQAMRHGPSHGSPGSHHRGYGHRHANQYMRHGAAPGTATAAAESLPPRRCDEIPAPYSRTPIRASSFSSTTGGNQCSRPENMAVVEQHVPTLRAEPVHARRSRLERMKERGSATAGARSKPSPAKPYNSARYSGI